MSKPNFRDATTEHLLTTVLFYRAFLCSRVSCIQLVFVFFSLKVIRVTAQDELVRGEGRVFEDVSW